METENHAADDTKSTCSILHSFAFTVESVRLQLHILGI